MASENESWPDRLMMRLSIDFKIMGLTSFSQMRTAIGRDDDKVFETVTTIA